MKYRGYLYVAAGLILLFHPLVKGAFFACVHIALIALGVMLIVKQVRTSKEHCK